MRRVPDVLALARAAAERTRLPGWRNTCQVQCAGKLALLEKFRTHVATLPDYCYRRVWALMRRNQQHARVPDIEYQRVYRSMNEHRLRLGWLRERRVRRWHDGHMTEWFVKTMKHDYTVDMDKPDVPTTFAHLACAFEHYKESPVQSFEIAPAMAL